ncbi:C40 family peptidase [Faecalibacillus faecis]|uniref:C40 family peptidase n=1 Tax=Faecalibacillus faecis TaxID=1982628 RepID=UPI0038674834
MVSITGIIFGFTTLTINPITVKADTFIIQEEEINDKNAKDTKLESAIKPINTKTTNAMNNLNTVFTFNTDAKIIAPKKIESKTNDLVASAKTMLGLPYVWGATGPNSYDCSGFTQKAYSMIGISIPRTSQAQYAAGTKVAFNELSVGDLILFNTYTDYGHVGIYLGNGSFIHASSGSKQIIISSLSGYYLEHYAGAVRYLK